ncbi:MAG: hypothetical protein ACK5TK_08515 [Betaproteobacteria bacterium]
MNRRALRYAAAFWLAAAAFILLDWLASTPHNRFAEPPPWSIGQPANDTGAHCAAAPAAKK